VLTEPDRGSPEHWAALTPDAPAVIDRDAAMTYAEWDDRANRVADALADHGLDRGDRLGMRFRLGVEWFVVQRALMKLGVAQVAVNWRLTPSEARYILTDSGAKGLACNDADAAAWASHDVGLLVTVGQPDGAPGLRYEDLVRQGAPTPRFGRRGTDMVLYTSGTTGAPKGVAPSGRRHRTDLDVERLVAYAKSVGKVPPFPRHARSLLALPVHHGAGPAAATAACARGGVSVLLDPYDAEEALRLIERHRIDVWSAVPTMLMRIKALPADLVDRYDLSSLTSLNLGAAPVPFSLKEWIVEHLGDQVLWEGYGCSEVGMITAAAPEHQLAKPGTSGLPYDGVRLAIVDDDWNHLPPGTTGEIAVDTPLGFSGYLGRAPLGDDVVRDGYYRTGDVGHLDHDGFLFITDRATDMIVAGGVNIYPAEIEKALVEHPDVVEAAVIGIPHDDLGEQAMAFVVVRPGSDLAETDLRRLLEGRLASYKHPRTYEFTDELPINPMGKIQKTELRARFWEGRERRV
jgi:long-chain acyl-CoA synthetase